MFNVFPVLGLFYMLSVIEFNLNTVIKSIKEKNQCIFKWNI